jgi:hypothetical protein
VLLGTFLPEMGQVKIMCHRSSQHGGDVSGSGARKPPLDAQLLYKLSMFLQS